ncbi:MAG: hypothetical protein U5S82_08540 [Gammaproteobacteria bacterium]|nr:hypothetical protein [Gammaproteobacteria bacterium]
MDANRRRTILQLGALVVIFLLPVVLSTAIYFFGDQLTPQETSAMGSLITPARPLPVQAVADPSGATAPLAELFGKWTIVFLAREQCGPSCAQRLRDMNKVRQALGEDSHRAQTLLLVDRPVAGDVGEAFRALREELPRLLVRTGGTDGLAGEFTESFNVDAAPWGRTYLVDPLGNLMMVYPAGTDPKWVLIDLRTLLKASQIG